MVALQRPAGPLPTPPSPELILWNTTHVIKTSSWVVLIQSYLFIGPFPETSHDEDHGHRRLQVGANGLDVNEELASLAGLDYGDPEDGDQHQQQHKHPSARWREPLVSILLPEILPARSLSLLFY